MIDSNRISPESLSQIERITAHLRGDSGLPPNASVIIPVNAQSDLATVLPLLRDLEHYAGPYRIEVILVINNYPAQSPPEAIDQYSRAGIRVVAEPDAHRPGEVVIVSARALGVAAAQSNITIHFDADCRVPHPADLLNWYIATLQKKGGLAYSHVTFYDLRPLASVHAKILVHHVVRFIKRTLLGIPTTRGSNYAVSKELFESCYRMGRLCVDMQIGPAARMLHASVSYSGRRRHYVLTSGRRFKGGWGKILKYNRYRLGYNLRTLKGLNSGFGKKSLADFDQENENRQTFDNPGPEM